MASSYIRNAVAQVRRVVVRTVVLAATATVTLEVTTQIPSQGRSSDAYRNLVDHQVTPLLRKWLDPESE